jgi:hypothetical protein
MPALSDTQKENVRFHLAYNLDGVEDGDAVLLEDRINNVQSSAWIVRTQELLDDCEFAYVRQRSSNQETDIDRKTTIVGDVNRTTVSYARERSNKRRDKDWIATTDLLSLHLMVPNYRNPDTLQSRLLRRSVGNIPRLIYPSSTPTLPSLSGVRLSASPIDPLALISSNTLYLLPSDHTLISLYTGSTWAVVSIPANPQIPIPAGLTLDRNYDVFAFLSNLQTPAYEFTIWTNDTTRSIPLSRQDGAPVRSDNPTRKYLGTIRVSDIGAGVRGVFQNPSISAIWNLYNPQLLALTVTDSTNSWAYSGTWRPKNNSIANRTSFVLGNPQTISGREKALGNRVTAGVYQMTAIGVDSTIAPSGLPGFLSDQVTGGSLEAHWSGVLNPGSHFLQDLELASGSATFYGTAGIAGLNTGLITELWA